MTITVLDNMEYSSDLTAQNTYQSNAVNGSIDSYTKLLIHADGVNGSQSFSDASFSNKAITPYGNARIQNATPPIIYGNVKLSSGAYKFGSTSAYFDGSGDYLGIVDLEDWNFGTGDFTVECWYCPLSLTGASQWRGLVCQRYSWTSNHSWSLQVDQGNAGFNFCWSLNGTTGYGTPAFGGALTIGQWYHVCVSRVGANLYCACNGTVTVYTGTASAFYNSTNIVAVGRLDSSTGGDIYGYIDEVRISKGIARYTSNFTPPTQPYEVDSYTKLLMHMDGVNNSIGFTIDNWNFTKFSSYVFFDGSGDYLQPADSADFAPGTGDFTIDLWVWLINGGHGNAWSRIFETLNYPNSGGFNLSTYNTENPARLSLQLSNGTVLINTDSSVSNDAWHHVAIVRSGTSLKLYIDGSAQTTQPTNSTNFTSGKLSIGGNLTGTESFLGYVDEFRFSKGIARWTSNFTPPTSPYDRSNATLLPYTDAATIYEGSYSLKAIATTSSLNKTLTRTISSPINLTSHAYIIGKIRASRTGSNIKIGFHDSGGTTTEITPNITAADTWQTIQLDISGVSDANKDAIDQIIITVVNADADNTFYLDNFFAVDATDYAAGMQVSKTVAYAVLNSIVAGMNVSKVVAYAVLGPFEDDLEPMLWVYI